MGKNKKRKDKFHITCFNCRKKGYYPNRCTKQAKEGDKTSIALLVTCLNTDDDNNKEFAFTQAHVGIPKT
eukprot:7715784-Ditylum_brightwellii.AAC.1